MKPSFMLSVAASLLSVQLISQSVDVTVHFPKGSDVMENESLSQLKLWVMENRHKKHDPLVLRGHTDHDAGNEYNLNLSERRNARVRNFLEQAGFDKIRIQSHGESWPICNSEDEACMHQNRRVEVILFDLNEEQWMLDDAKQIPQVQFIDQSNRSTLHGAEGTQIEIPANAFVFKHGSPVSGNVRLELKEYYNLKDCILSHLTTTSNQQLLESGGMIHIQAFVGEEEVILSPEASIEVLFASQSVNKEEGMEIFKGSLENGTLNWTKEADIKRERSIKIQTSTQEREYTTRKKETDAEIHELVVGGRVVNVSFGKDRPTIAHYCSTPEDRGHLTEDERQSILDYVNGSGNGFKSNKSATPFVTSGMGWINCDRFVREPFIIDQIVQTDVVEDAHYLLVFEDINSIMRGIVGSDGKLVFKNVPPGKRATLICFKEGWDDQHTFGLKQFTVSKEIEPFETKSTDIKEVERRLQIFDRMI